MVREAHHDIYKVIASLGEEYFTQNMCNLSYTLFILCANEKPNRITLRFNTEISCRNAILLPLHCLMPTDHCT